MPITFTVADTIETPVDCSRSQRAYELDSKSPVITQSTRRTTDTQTVLSTENGFVWACLLAYNQHHHLVLRPDDVWLAIMIQFSMYMKDEGEKLRHKFVDHHGQKELCILLRDNVMLKETAEAFVKDMSIKVTRDLKDHTIGDWCVPDFSTTTATDRIVGSLVLMASMKRYYSYCGSVLCGIPRITLQGMVNDWKLIEERASRLLEFDNDNHCMTIWYTLLKPILSQFTAAFSDKPDLSWWNRMCSYRVQGSGSADLSGWITVFCLFSETGGWFGHRLPVPVTAETWPRIPISHIPSGICRIDVTFLGLAKGDNNNDEDNKNEYEFLAGHSGMLVTSPTTVQPHVTWMLREKPKEKEKENESEDDDAEEDEDDKQQPTPEMVNGMISADNKPDKPNNNVDI